MAGNHQGRLRRRLKLKLTQRGQCRPPNSRVPEDHHGLAVDPDELVVQGPIFRSGLTAVHTFQWHVFSVPWAV